MRWRSVVAAVLALALGAGSAHAVNKYVRTDGVASWANATSHASASTSASLSTAIANAVAGDNVLLAAGTYGTSIAPVNSGTVGNRITFVGDIANPAATTVTGFSLPLRNYVTVKGVKTAGSLLIDGRLNPDVSSANHCLGDSIAYCIVQGGVDIFGADDAVLYRNTLGTPSATNTKLAVNGAPYADSSAAAANKRLVLIENTCYFGSDGQSSNAVTFANSWLMTVQRNRWHLTGGGNLSDSHARNQYGLNTCLFEDNYWGHFNNTVGYDQYLMTLRDKSQFNTFRRETLYTEPGSPGNTKFVPSVSGSYQNTNRYNRYEDCRIKVNGFMYYQNPSKGDIYIGNVFDCSISPNVFNLQSDSLQFYHNTFYDTGNAALLDNGTYGPLTNTTMRYNIFYSTVAGTHLWMQPSGTAANWDFNLYYSPANDSTAATSLGRVGPASSGCASRSIDCNSRWGNPAFTNAAAGDFTLGSGSLALGLGPDGYVGALAPASTDTERPAPITTLATSAPTPSTITLSWTAVGDDSLTGTATSYLIRRNFGVAITTEPLWNAATVVSSPPTPQVAGSAETKVITGLSQNSNYYFAVRAVDEAGHVGALSNSPLGTTAPDVTRPAPITTLTATPTGPNVIRLNWTAVGDDSLTGQATSYEIRRALSPITDLTAWGAATVVVVGLGANTVGTAEVYSAASLQPATTYYFAVRVSDEVPNVSALSNSPGATTFDNVLPATISDLVVKSTTANSATISWTAPGDDGSVGTATFYEVRYRLTSPIVTEGDWVSSTAASGPPTPQVAGSDEQMTVAGLTSDRTYFFAVRATDDSGNRGLISNSPAGVTPDVTAPGQITTLSSTGVTQTTVTLRWTAVGDDGAVGTATTLAGRYSAAGAITNETAWTNASVITNMPVPGVAGTIQSVTVAGLTPGVAYHFAIRCYDEVPNTGVISNDVARTTLGSDVTRPAAPTITAVPWPGVLDGALVVFSAVGDDSLTGTASSYTVRYRLDSGLAAGTWDAQGATSRTYRWPTTQVPKAAGLADTVYVRDLRPGRTVWFGVIVTDDQGFPSALSNIDSVTTPASIANEYAQPAVVTYGGAGSGSRPPYFPFVSLDGSAVDTAECRYAARRVAIGLSPEYADSAGAWGKLISLASLQRMKAMNPSVRLFPEPPGAAAYYRPDNAAPYSLYAHMYAAVRDSGGGLPAGLPAPGGAWVPGAYSDSTGGKGFLWSNAPGYRGWFYQTYDSGRQNPFNPALIGVAGTTNWNINLAYQPTPGRFPVARAIADIVVAEIVTRKHPDGTWVWDGVRWDLFGMSSSFSALQYEDIDHVRAGYATKVLFDTAYTQAAQYLIERVRRAANDAGRPGFTLSSNGGSGTAYDAANGWMREYFPNQQGGTWWTNVFWYPGGLANDAERFAYRPRDNWLFTFACDSGDSCLALDLTSTTVRREVRWGLGTAALYDGALAYGPEYASVPKGGGFHRWNFDEYAVDTVTAQAAVGQTRMGWLGAPVDRPYMTTPPINLADQLQGSGGFEGSQVNLWTRTASSQISIATVSDTVRSGSLALRARVASPQAQDWSAVANSNIRFAGTTGDSVTVTFWARSDIARPLQVGLLAKFSGAIRSSWSVNCRQWIYPGAWRPYRLHGVLVSNAQAADSFGVAFWFGDTTGTVWIDDVTATKGRPRGGLMVREFRRGAVIVNPYARTDTATFGRVTRQIEAQAGGPRDVNAGNLLAAGAAIVVPPNDARFVLFPVDSLRPSRVTNLLANGATSTTALVSWTAPGDDSLSGVPAALVVKRSAFPIVTEGDWTAASVVAGSPAPTSGGLAQSFTVTGLSPSSTYYFAVRATDDALFTGAISNSDSVSTLGVDTCFAAARPGRVTNLVARISGTSVYVDATMPGPDQFGGNEATDMVNPEIHYSASPITTDAEFWAASNADGSPSCNGDNLFSLFGNNYGGTAQSIYTIGDWQALLCGAPITPASTIYVAAKFFNVTSGLWSCLSNSDSVSIPAVDTCLAAARPGRVTDLVATGGATPTATVTAPGPTQFTGDGYDVEVYIKYAATPITTDAQFFAATQWSAFAYNNPGDYDGPGQPMGIAYGALPPGVWWVATKSRRISTGAWSCLSNTDSVEIAVPPGTPPNAAFAVTPSSGAQSLAIACTDQSTGAVSWEWYARRLADEADPQISAEQNPTFTLARVGVYRISQQVFNADGFDSLGVNVNVTCTPPSPITYLTAASLTDNSVSVIYRESGDNGDVGVAASFEMRYRKGLTFTLGDWASATVVPGLPAPVGPGTEHTVEVLGIEPGSIYAFAVRGTDVDGCVGDMGTIAFAGTAGTTERTIGVSFGTRTIKLRIGGRR